MEELKMKIDYLFVCEQRFKHKKQMKEQGTPIPREEESDKISYEEQEPLRKALNIILMQPDLIKKIDGNKREQYFDSLIFQRIS